MFNSLLKVQSRVKELSEKARDIADKEFDLDAGYVAKRLKEIDDLVTIVAGSPTASTVLRPS